MKTAIKIGMMGLSIVLLAGSKEKSPQTSECSSSRGCQFSVR